MPSPSSEVPALLAPLQALQHDTRARDERLTAALGSHLSAIFLFGQVAVL